MPLTLPEERGRRRGWALASVELCSGNLRIIIVTIIAMIVLIVTCERHQVRRVS